MPPNFHEIGLATGQEKNHHWDDYKINELLPILIGTDYPDLRYGTRYIL
jgi:hypothetical protein